jgi:hypothetical protein
LANCCARCSYLSLPLEAVTLTVTDSNNILVGHGRLFFGAKEAVGPEKKTWTWLVLGIGNAAQKASSTAQQHKQ